jgi:hypothetical protein
VATVAPSSNVAATVASRLVTAGLRRHQRQVRSIRPTGRAAIGSPRSQRRKSADRSAALV